jgi:hypothetical protein
MFFVLYDALVLCLCLYGGDDTLIFPIGRGAMTFAGLTWAVRGRTMLMTALRGRLYLLLRGKACKSGEQIIDSSTYCA